MPDHRILPNIAQSPWPWDHLLAQQELEDFEQADEYFGYFGDGDL